jgi:hypothetical protein
MVKLKISINNLQCEMSKKSITNSTKNLVQVLATGFGSNVWAYAINDETYAQLLKLDEPFEMEDLILSEYKAGQLVCWGPDVSNSCSIKININGNEKELSIIFTDEDCPLAEELAARKIGKSEPYIEFNRDNKRWLGETFNLNGLNHVFLHSITWKDMKLELELPINPAKFKYEKIKLLACELDSGFDLARITYDNGLLDGQEEDVIGVEYDGRAYYFESSEASHSIHESRCIVSRGIEGWRINDNINFSRSF